MRLRTELTLLRAIAIFVAGVVGGTQIALYLFDLYDDGVADVRSGIIAAVMLVLGLILVAWSFRGSRREPPAT